jgi:hypothetical protein
MRSLVVVLVAGLAGLALAQDTKKPDAPKTETPPVRVQRALPANWNKLGLTSDQKDAIYKAQAEYGAKIAALRKQIAELQKEQRTAMEKVLTEAQKTRLRELATEKLPKTGGDQKPESKPKPQ